MADIIDFALERAKRKSGLNCSITLKDMLEEGYDPCDPLDIQAYNAVSYTHLTLPTSDLV